MKSIFENRSCLCNAEQFCYFRNIYRVGLKFLSCRNSSHHSVIYFNSVGIKTIVLLKLSVNKVKNSSIVFRDLSEKTLKH